MTTARLPVTEDVDAFVLESTPITKGLVRSLGAGSLVTGRRNVMLVGSNAIRPSAVSVAAATN